MVVLLNLEGHEALLQNITNESFGDVKALALNIFCILVVIPWAVVSLSNDLGTAKSKNVTLQQVFFNGNWNLSWLSLARLFLFQSRDMWFEVPLPFYLRSPPCPIVHSACTAESCPEGLSPNPLTCNLPTP